MHVHLNAQQNVPVYVESNAQQIVSILVQPIVYTHALRNAVDVPIYAIPV